MGERRRRGASRQAGLALLVAGAAFTALSCGGGDLTPPPTSGSVTITTSTTGPESDADGYAVTIDGGTETPISARKATGPRSPPRRRHLLSQVLTPEGPHDRRAAAGA